ncbi:beta-propeller domain-containing protein [Candidatus Woesearchaeota archaeon]|nr:beta-propeller domain-containing protein [Candidatus Woesearchaeota archaeon]
MAQKTYLFAIIVATLFAVSCAETQPGTTTPGVEIELGSTQELKKFSSNAEIKEYLNQAALESAQGYDGSFGTGLTRATFAMDTEESVAQIAAPMAAEAGGTKSDSSASEYSETNVQVEGVDEADFVKNDGKYIYVISGSELVIVDAYPADDAEILSETRIDGNVRDLFVNGDRLAVFADDYEQVYMIPEYGYYPVPRTTTRTHVYVYDISDRSDPDLVKDYNVNGYYFQSRMIGDYVYFICKDSVYYYNNLVDVPVVRESAKVIVEPDVYYFDNPEGSYVFHTVASFDIASDADSINAKSYLMGHSNNLYVSQDNIYIAYQRNYRYYYYEQNNEERFYEVVVPLLPEDVQAEINSIKSEGLASYETWDKISAVLEEMYNSMEESEKEDLVDEISEAVEEYEANLAKERSKTVIHKISINEGEIEYDSRGEVPGYLLNQFSMDEHEGYFRVATTSNIYTRRQSIMYNNVYVLDSGMEIVGELEEIAEDERIYSTRFIGERLYMVTFQRIDPLFVIDLSSPSNPSILGELKIPGYSDYLHPYDEDHIIGIGKETEENQWGGVSVGGVKLALFDVSDVSNPVVVDSYQIGQPGTDSEALYEHKAFLFDKEKNLLVIPVREIKGDRYRDSRYGYYMQRVWQGAYVFSLTPEDGFEVQGKVTHNEGDEDYYSYYGSSNAVRRALYMDDVLYTVSNSRIKMNDLANELEEINSVKLPYTQPVYRYPMIDVVEDWG